MARVVRGWLRAVALLAFAGCPLGYDGSRFTCNPSAGTPCADSNYECFTTDGGSAGFCCVSLNNTCATSQDCCPGAMCSPTTSTCQ